MIDQNKLIAIIATAIQDTQLDYPVIEPGVARESIPFGKSVLNALDRAGLTIEQKNGVVSERSGD